MTTFKPNNHHAWYMIEDFNEIISQDEEQGGRLRIKTQMKTFREALEDNNLYDLGWMGISLHVITSMVMRLLQKRDQTWQ